VFAAHIRDESQDTSAGLIEGEASMENYIESLRVFFVCHANCSFLLTLVLKAECQEFEKMEKAAQ
jgi:hypothetical protein